MRAIVLQGAYDVRVESVADAGLRDEHSAVVRIPVSKLADARLRTLTTAEALAQAATFTPPLVDLTAIKAARARAARRIERSGRLRA